MTVDHRPLLERKAKRIVRAVLLGIAGCGLLGAALGAELAIAFTRPNAPKGTPPC